MTATSRRARQLVEIAALVVAGKEERAAGLAFEHLAEFPEDADLLASLVCRSATNCRRSTLPNTPRTTR